MTSEHPGHSMAEIILAGLRRAGWTVAVHNDYEQQGKPHTFWLFTHKVSRKFAKGEGGTDLEALEEAAHEAALAMDAPVQMSVPEIPGYPHIDLAEARRTLAGYNDHPGPDSQMLAGALAKHLGDAIAVIETRFAAPDEFYDAEEAGDALRAGSAAFVELEGYQTLLVDFHKRHHEGGLGECPIPICVEGRQHLLRKAPSGETA